MKEYIDRHKKADRVKWWLTLIAFVVVGVMLTGIILGWFTKASEKENNTKLMTMNIKSISPSQYPSYGISGVESAYEVTATVKPIQAENKAMDWSVAWKNASSSFANGKTVTDYVTITPAADGALTAVLECKRDFGEQVILTVTSREFKEVSATATVEFTQKIHTVTGLQIGDSFSNWTGDGRHVLYNTYTSSEDITLDVMYGYTDCTKEDSFELKVQISFPQAVVDAMTEQGIECTYAADTYVDILGSGNFVFTLIKDRVPVVLQYADYRAKFFTAMRNIGLGNECATIRVTATGSYSTFTQEFSVLVDESCTVEPVTDVGLEETEYIF